MFSYSSFLDFIIRLFLSFFREFARFPLVITTTWKSVYKPSTHKAFPQYTYIIWELSNSSLINSRISLWKKKKKKKKKKHFCPYRYLCPGGSHCELI